MGAAALASLALAHPAMAAQVRFVNADATAGAVKLRVGKATTGNASASGAASTWISTKGGVIALRALQGRTLLLTRKVRVKADERVTVALTRVGPKRRLVLVREPAVTDPAAASLRLVSLAAGTPLTLAADGLPIVRNLPAGRASMVVPYPSLGPARLTLRRGSQVLATLDAELPGGVLTVLAAVPSGRGIRLAALPRSAAAPRATVTPSVTSTRALNVVETGDLLTCQRGTWAPASGLTFAYEWLRDGDLIAGATAATYRLAGTADADREITCRVTARSATGGSVRRLAANGATLPPLPVVNPDSPPTVQGVPDAGQTVTCDAGQWTGARSFAYAWLRNGTAIDGATDADYPVVQADDAQQLTCRVTAENRAGTAAAASIAVQPGDTPGNVNAPQVMALFKDGTAVASTDGTWSPADGLAFTYAWLRCDAAGLDCTVIDGATASSFTPGAADVGSTLRVRVIATRAGFASSPADSDASASVAPLSTGAPTISGTTRDGGLLTAGTGQWNTVTGLDFTYLWESSANGTDWTAAGTAATRALLPADVGLLFRITVGASKGGSAETLATSGQTARVSPLATGAPAITGTLRDGQVLTAASPDADWNGATGLSRTYVWESAPDGTTWTTVQTATTTSATNAFTLRAADVGKTLRVTVTASKSGSAGTQSSASPDTGGVSPIWVGATPARPGGTAVDGSTLTAPALSEGDWSGSATTTLAYQWQRCDPTCDDIAGATAATYALQPADVGTRISVILLGSAAGGPTPARRPARPRPSWSRRSTRCCR